MLACFNHASTEELPIRLAHRVKDLDELPLGLHEMPSIKKVKNWYAQSFDVSESGTHTLDVVTGIYRLWIIMCHV